MMNFLIFWCWVIWSHVHSWCSHVKIVCRYETNQPCEFQIRSFNEIMYDVSSFICVLNPDPHKNMAKSSMITQLIRSLFTRSKDISTLKHWISPINILLYAWCHRLSVPVSINSSLKIIHQKPYAKRMSKVNSKNIASTISLHCRYKQVSSLAN